MATERHKPLIIDLQASEQLGLPDSQIGRGVQELVPRVGVATVAPSRLEDACGRWLVRGPVPLALRERRNNGLHGVRAISEGSCYERGGSAMWCLSGLPQSQS